ncbi:MAG: hypothetical protein K0Q49_1964 [Haloplasmataceae bacterium]|jgi:uncharacterized protein (TIGR02678 family)|nr:hypothetical protein [Haloplasmataceae bacterium]
MKELEILLDRFWISKNENKEIYYAIKDNMNNFKSFLTDKLGYHIIMNPDVIKLEKIPGNSEPWMGITYFESQMEYVFLCLLLMFLEDKGKEEQFVLSNVVEFIQANYLGDDKIDWTIYKQRKNIIKVIKFAIQLELIKVDDGDEQKFLHDVQTEVLYESTGLSRHFVRNFTTNIMNYESYKDFENSEWGEINSDKGIQRRQRVYRRLIMSPIVYNEGNDDVDFDYIKKQRSFIENDLEKYLDYNLHVHKNAALIILKQDDNLKDTFPNSKAISDIILLFNTIINLKIKNKDFIINRNDQLIISKAHFISIIEELKEKYANGWSKEYKEMTLESLCNEILKYMEEFNFLKNDEIKNEVIMFSLIGKVIGQYPDSFLTNKGDEENE